MAKRWIQAAGLLLALGVAAGATLAATSWAVRDAGMRRRIVEHLKAASGLAIDARGPMRLRLLPLPSIELGNVSMSGLDGALRIEADQLIGRLSLVGLVSGDLHVLTASLDSPTIVIDLDRVGPLAAAMIDDVATTSKEVSKLDDAPRREPLGFLRTQGLSIRAGVVRLASRNAQHDMVLTDVTATVAWPEGRGEGRIDGDATWRGAAATFFSVLDAPADLLAGGDSKGSMRLRSPVLDLSATGSIGLAGGFHGAGTLAASTSDLFGFLRVAGTPLPQLRAFHEATLSGQATLAPDSLSLSDVNLGLDDMSFQGALVVHDDAGRPGLAGTLDTARIDLNPFLSALPSPQAADGTWNEAPFDLHAAADDDIDLRISASKARIGSMEVEDGSLSLQSGRGRMELSLGEARAYDGLLKGRVVATEDQGTTDIRADLSVSRLDLMALARDFPLSRGLAGTTTGHVMLEGQGRSYYEALRALDGRGQFSVRSGGVGMQLATTLVTLPPASPPAAIAMLNRLASFDSVSADFDVVHGLATLRDGDVVWADAKASLRGAASLPRRSLAITASLGNESDEEALAGPSPQGITLVGPWRDLTLSTLDPGRPIVNAVGR